MSEERTVYRTNEQVQIDYLNEVMRQMDLDKERQGWVLAAYRLQGIKKAFAMLDGWGWKR